MKIYAALFTILLATALPAQQNTNAPAPIETPAAAPALTNVPGTGTNAPAAKNQKKRKRKASGLAAAKKKDAAAELKIEPLVAGPAVVIASNVNVRGQAGLKGEVLTRLTKGDTVTVIEEIKLKKSGPDEPSAWAKISFPTNGHVWVNSTFIEATNKTVVPKKLNLRGGPGENYSVLGTLKRGDTVKEVSTKGGWTEIEAPADAFAFVAARYLKQEPVAAPTTTGTNAPAEPAPTPATVAENQPVAPAPTAVPAPAAPATEPAAAPDTNAPAPAPGAAANNAAPPTEPEPPPKRVVQREGVVRGTVSIQAPTPFALVSPDNGRTIDYLYTTSHELDLREYKGMRIVVTGEESLDERWRNTPVITIERIQVLE